MSKQCRARLITDNGSNQTLQVIAQPVEARTLPAIRTANAFQSGLALNFNQKKRSAPVNLSPENFTIAVQLIARMADVHRFSGAISCKILIQASCTGHDSAHPYCSAPARAVQSRVAGRSGRMRPFLPIRFLQGLHLSR